MSDPENKAEADRQLLAAARAKGTGATLGAYLKLSGPGWLQSALTLGGGSLASSLYLGVLAGFTMMWLQPVAMILGIIMLSAIGYVALSTGKPAFRAVADHVNPVLAWGWALASMLANMVWAMPQYSLATGVLQQNLFPELLAGTFGKIIISIVLLVTATIVTWSYGGGGRGVKIYEWMLKGVVALIVTCFFGVVVKLSASDGLPWGEILAGFIPNPRAFTEPAAGFLPLLNDVAAEHREFWKDVIVSQQRDVVWAAAATAVGINMTFLFPYTLMKRGWGKEFRGLVRFDLATGMFIPFVLATSCVIMASANRFHTQPQPGILERVEGEKPPKQLKAYDSLLRTRLGGEGKDLLLTELEQKLDPAERRLAATLVKRDAFDLAKSLEPLMGGFFANVVFGIGVLGMTLSTITLLMLVSGFIFCEVLGLPQGGWPHRIGCLFAATGVVGPFIWSGAAFYLAVPTSVFGLMLIPIAYITFFLMMNQKSLLGNEMPQGGGRIGWNVAMGVATTVMGAAAFYAVWDKAGWWGMGAIIAFGLAAVVAHFARPSKSL